MSKKVMEVSALRKGAMQAYKEGKMSVLGGLSLPVYETDPKNAPMYHAIPHALFQKLGQLLTTYLEDDSVPDDTLLDDLALTVNEITSESIALDGLTEVETDPHNSRLH